MSISAKPWDSAGGASSVPDASETTKGKIQIATSAEATTGTDDLKAMTPLTVKERIDAAIVGGVEYKGIFNVTSATPDLSNAEKGDMYIVSGSGTLYGKSWVAGDHLLINDDMGGSISNSKIDKVDNTDQVTSVNAQTGAVSLSGNNLDGDHTASNYSTTSDKIEKHLEGIDNKFGTLGTASTAASTDFQPIDAQLTDVAGLTPGDGKFIVGDGSNFVTESGATARASLGLVIGTDVAPIAAPAFTGNATAVTQSQSDNSTNIATTAYVDAAVAGAGGATDLNGLSDVTITSAASGNLLEHNGSGQFINVAKSTINVGTFNDDNTYQPKDAQLTDVAGLTPGDGKFIVGDGSNFVTESGATARASLGLVIGTDVAPIAAPAFTGNATAVTQSQSDNSTNIATTAYVDAAVAGAGGGGSVPSVTAASPSTTYTISTHAGIEEVYILTPSADLAVSVPAASVSGSGFKYQIKNLSSSYNLTITPTSCNVDGAATFVLNTQYQSLTMISDGSNYHVI